MARQIPPFHRTQGDGMEKIESLDAVEQTVILQPKESGELTTPDAIKEKTPLNKSLIKNLSEGIKLTPHAVDIKQKKILASLKNKEPKFVPYEPYKAAVRPIVPPTKKTIFQQAGKKKSKAYADILKIHKTTVTQENNSADAISENTASEDNWQCKLKVLESEMQTLREENEQLENQLKFQVQVNGELKNLLVAAVGEDMETKVHVLTEDKLHLAQALLRSAESLTSHQEQTEWLAGQCEVWRSKFLASRCQVKFFYNYRRIMLRLKEKVKFIFPEPFSV